MASLSKGPADHIRKNLYKYVTRLEKDLTMINKIQSTQTQVIGLIGAAITAALISVGNFIAGISKTMYEKGEEIPVMTAIIVLCSVVGFFCLIKALMWSCNRYKKRGGDTKLKYRIVPTSRKENGKR